jgi:hypothetical protein
MGFGEYVAWAKVVVIIILLVLMGQLIFNDQINPGFPFLYSAKRIEEKAFLKLKVSPEAKVDYYTLLLENRIRELENLVDNGSYGQVLNSALRYSATAGEVTNLISQNGLKPQAQKTLTQLTIHQQRLQTILDKYPKDVDGNVEYKYIIDDQNYLKAYTDQLKKLVSY